MTSKTTPAVSLPLEEPSDPSESCLLSPVDKVFYLGERTVQAFGESRCERPVTAIFDDLRRDETTAATVASPVISAFDTQIGGLDHG